MQCEMACTEALQSICKSLGGIEQVRTLYGALAFMLDPATPDTKREEFMRELLAHGIGTGGTRAIIAVAAVGCLVIADSSSGTIGSAPDDDHGQDEGSGG